MAVFLGQDETKFKDNSMFFARGRKYENKIEKIPGTDQRLFDGLVP
jgi:hypothetical protein